MSLSNNNGKKHKHLLMPGSGETKINPMRARVTAGEERIGSGNVTEIEIPGIEQDGH